MGNSIGHDFFDACRRERDFNRLIRLYRVLFFAPLIILVRSMKTTRVSHCISYSDDDKWPKPKDY